MTNAANGAIRFHTKILTAGKAATGIRIPDEVIDKLGGGKKPAVSVTIHGYTYRSTVAVMGGRFMVGVNAENREKAKVAGGDDVDVDIALDTEPREVELPADFATALNRHAKARKYFRWLGLQQAEGVRAGHRRGQDTGNAGTPDRKGGIRLAGSGSGVGPTGHLVKS